MHPSVQAELHTHEREHTHTHKHTHIGALDTLFLLAGDGDFLEALKYVADVRHKRVILAGFRGMVSVAHTWHTHAHACTPFSVSPLCFSAPTPAYTQRQGAHACLHVTTRTRLYTRSQIHNHTRTPVCTRRYSDRYIAEHARERAHTHPHT